MLPFKTVRCSAVELEVITATLFTAPVFSNSFHQPWVGSFKMLFCSARSL